MKQGSAAERSCAFSLIELLTVIAIIGILTGILFPTLSKAKSAARSLKCQNHLKQIGMGMSLYWIDFEKPLPLQSEPDHWMIPLKRHAQITENFWICPATKTFPRGTIRYEKGKVNHTWMVNDNPQTYAYQGSYTINGWIYKKHYSDPEPLASTRYYNSESSFVHPALTPTFADSVWVEAKPGEYDEAARNLFTGDGGYNLGKIAIPRHAAPLSAAVTNFIPTNRLPGCVNVTFADNHTESVRLERLWSLHWHKSWFATKRRELP